MPDMPDEAGMPGVIVGLGADGVTEATGVRDGVLEETALLLGELVEAGLPEVHGVGTDCDTEGLAEPLDNGFPE